MKKSSLAKKSLRLPAFAKINSCLYIIAKRPDGYHELRTIFQTISLRDTLHLTLAAKKSDVFELNFTSDDPAMPLGQENLVVRAVNAFEKEFGLRGALSVHLEKKIPVARGLGGGSSDAAATLIGLMRLNQAGTKASADVSLAKLIKIAAGLGADVPFFLFGGRAMAVGRGDEIYPLPDQPKRSVVVVSPKGIGVSTKDAYAWASAELTKDQEPHKLFRFCALCWSRQDARLSNDFEGPVFRRHPRLEAIRAGLLQRGAADAALAGSGSAVFGIFRNPAQARRSAREFPEDSVFVVETLSRANYGRAMGWRPR
jgi:4-diphosphocytidyl-2-C-methyl-D-erythritol kinase